MDHDRHFTFMHDANRCKQSQASTALPWSCSTEARLTLTLLCFLLGLCWAFQQTASGQESSDPADLAQKLERALNGDSYRERQRATFELWQQREQTRQAVRDAEQSGNLEVSRRASWILKQWRAGISDQTPKALSKQIYSGGLLDRNLDELDSELLLEELLLEGAFAAVAVAIQESQDSADYELLLGNVTGLMYQYYPLIVSVAVEQSKEQQLLTLLQSLRTGPSGLAISAIEFQQQLGDASHSTNAEPAVEDSLWDRDQESRFKGELALQSGNIDQTLQLASERNDDAIVLTLQYYGQRWPELIQSQRAIAEAADADPMSQARAQAWVLSAAAHAGDQEAFQWAKQQLLAGLKDSENDPDMDAEDRDNLCELRWRFLVGYLVVDETIEAMRANWPAKAAVVACLTDRFVVAKEICVGDEPLTADLIQAKINAALEAQDKYSKQVDPVQARAYALRIAPELEQLYSLALLLKNTHHADLAKRIYFQLAQSNVSIPAFRGRVSLYDYTLIEMQQALQYDMVVELITTSKQTRISSRSRSMLAFCLSVKSASFETVLAALKRMHRQWPEKQLVGVTAALFQGLPAEGFDPLTDLDTLFQEICNVPMNGRRTLGVPQVIYINELTADCLELFAINERDDLVQTGRQLLADDGDGEMSLTIINRLIENGDWLKAEDRLQALANDLQSGRHEEAASLHCQALIIEMALARDRGFTDRQQELEEELKLILTTPSLTTKEQIARRLSDHQFYQLAHHAYQQLVPVALLKSQGLTSNLFGNILDGFVETKQFVDELELTVATDPNASHHTAHHLSDMALVSELNADAPIPWLYTYHAQKHWEARLISGITLQDEPTVAAALGALQTLAPLDINATDEQVPEVRKLGMAKIADAYIDQLVQSGEAYLAEFPLDALKLNNLAWACAVNKMHLEQAVKWSERSVFLEPESVTYRDTLAELCHVLGEHKQAWQIESDCLLDDSGQWHLHQQIEKYRQAMESKQ